MRVIWHFLVAGLLIGPAVSTASATETARLCYDDMLEWTTANFDETLSVSQFDPALGTLTLVTLTVTLDHLSVAEGELLNEEFSGTYTYTLNWDVSLSGLGSTLLQLADSAGGGGTLDPFDGTQDNLGPSGFSAGYPSNDLAMLFYGPLDSGFSDFLGTGTVDLNLSAVGSATFSGTVFPFEATQVTQAAGTVEVCYDYIPIPEPVGLMMLASGLPLVIVRRRRRR